jgi:hypothetical protein
VLSLLFSLLYLGLRRVFECLILLGRSTDRKELEILVLRHELSVLRRQAGRPRYEPRDRVLLAALSRALPRGRWATFAVTPETLTHLGHVYQKLDIHSRSELPEALAQEQLA